MLQAVVDRLPEHIGPCEITVLTTYPHEDRSQNPNEDVRIVSLRREKSCFQSYLWHYLSGLRASSAVQAPGSGGQNPYGPWQMQT